VGKNTQNKTVLTREFSSGGVVFKKDNENILWLIRKTSPSDLFPKSNWMLPKGWLDDEGEGVPGPMASGKIKATVDALEKTAVREVKEEGGVEAEIVEKIGTVKFPYNHPARGRVLKFVTFYLMGWKKDCPDGFDFETSEVTWLPFEEAYKTLSFSMEKSVLKKAKELLASVV
jgi:8-oxo-dGTP pyrophosphatase MutT (NUDIX family)